MDESKTYVPGQPGPIGWIVAQTPDGLRWVNPKALECGVKRSRITKSQKARINAFKVVLAEHETTSLTEAIGNFERDMDPDSEIAIWERIAAAYSAEIAERPNAGADERRLLYRVILTASNTGSTIDGVLGSLPRAKGLPNLARVINRWQSSRP